MRIFAVVIKAQRKEEEGGEMIHMDSLVVADFFDKPENEIRKHALEKCFQFYPLEDGFFEHVIEMVEVPRGWIVQAAALKHPKEDHWTVDDIWRD